MKLRFAALEDTRGILAVYRQYIHTPITFEYDLPSEEDFRARIREISAAHPYLVVEEEGRILGYAYAHYLRERLAYQWTCEASIYLDRSYTRRGLGELLYRVLMELLALQGMEAVYGCVTAPNPASERLHEKLGFRQVGVFHQSGYKDGRWHDVVWLEKMLGTHSCPPRPLIPFPETDPQRSAEILARYQRELDTL